METGLDSSQFRDKPCILCGNTLTDPNDRSTRAATLDFFVPFKYGGFMDPLNEECVCRRCSELKAALKPSRIARLAVGIASNAPGHEVSKEVRKELYTGETCAFIRVNDNDRQIACILADIPMKGIAILVFREVNSTCDVKQAVKATVASQLPVLQDAVCMYFHNDFAAEASYLHYLTLASHTLESPPAKVFILGLDGETHLVNAPSWQEHRGVANVAELKL